MLAANDDKFTNNQPTNNQFANSQLLDNQVFMSQVPAARVPVTQFEMKSVTESTPAPIQTEFLHQPRPTPVRQGKKSICRHYTRGLCTWGAECRFSHSLVPETSNYTPSMVPMMQTPNITMMPNPYGGQQQSELQRQRYALVMAGATGMFSMQVNGDQAVVTVGTTLIPFAVLPRSTLQHHLNALVDKQRGGLNYLVGESSVFWSMVKLLHTEGNTGSPFWDQAFRKAVAGQVSCMYFPSSTGCLTPNCPFIHEAPQLFNSFLEASNLSATSSSMGGSMNTGNNSLNPSHQGWSFPTTTSHTFMMPSPFGSHQL